MVRDDLECGAEQEHHHAQHHQPPQQGTSPSTNARTSCLDLIRVVIPSRSVTPSGRPCGGVRRSKAGLPGSSPASRVFTGSALPRGETCAQVDESRRPGRSSRRLLIFGSGQARHPYSGASLIVGLRSEPCPSRSLGDLRIVPVGAAVVGVVAVVAHHEVVAWREMVHWRSGSHAIAAHFLADQVLGPASPDQGPLPGCRFLADRFSRHQLAVDVRALFLV